MQKIIYFTDLFFFSANLVNFCWASWKWYAKSQNIVYGFFSFPWLCLFVITVTFYKLKTGPSPLFFNTVSFSKLFSLLTILISNRHFLVRLSLSIMDRVEILLCLFQTPGIVCYLQNIFCLKHTWHFANPSLVCSHTWFIRQGKYG